MRAAIVMGSKSDYPVVEKAEKILKQFDISYETRVISVHRTPVLAAEFARSAESEGFEIIIAAAGKAAHLGGVIAANTIVPVIGIPMKTSDFGGMDSLLSTVQMPKGIPVAMVAVGGAENAALLAIHILSIKYPVLRQKLREYRAQMEKETAMADAEVGNEYTAGLF